MLLPGSHPLNPLATPQVLVSQVVLTDSTVTQNPNEITDTHELVQLAGDDLESDVSGSVIFKVAMGSVKIPQAGGKMVLALRYTTVT